MSSGKRRYKRNAPTEQHEEETSNKANIETVANVNKSKKKKQKHEKSEETRSNTTTPVKRGGKKAKQRNQVETEPDVEYYQNQDEVLLHAEGEATSFMEENHNMVMCVDAPAPMESDDSEDETEQNKEQNEAKEQDSNNNVVSCIAKTVGRSTLDGSNLVQKGQVFDKEKFMGEVIHQTMNKVQDMFDRSGIFETASLIKQHFGGNAAQTTDKGRRSQNFNEEINPIRVDSEVTIYRNSVLDQTNAPPSKRFSSSSEDDDQDGVTNLVERVCLDNSMKIPDEVEFATQTAQDVQFPNTGNNEVMMQEMPTELTIGNFISDLRPMTPMQKVDQHRAQKEQARQKPTRRPVGEEPQPSTSKERIRWLEKQKEQKRKCSKLQVMDSFLT